MICMQNPQENTSLEILNLGSTVTPAELGTTLYDKPVVSIVALGGYRSSNLKHPETMDHVWKNPPKWPWFSFVNYDIWILYIYR